MNTSASVVSELEFGKDHGLIHEVVVTGRKVGAGATFWSRLAHNEDLFRKIVKEVTQMVVVIRSFDPVAFIGKNWSLVPEEHDARNDALTEVDFSRVLFETCLKDGETSITGEEKLKRLKANGNIRLNANIFLGLWEDYQTKKVNSVLEQLCREKGITYMDFFGDVLLGPGGGRGVLCLCRGVGVWCWGCSWLPSGWGAVGHSASLAS